MTLSNLSSSSGQVRQTLSAQAADAKLRGRYMTSASKSLDLLRLNIQNVINKEIDAVLKKYLDVSFFGILKVYEWATKVSFASRNFFNLPLKIYVTI